MSCVKVWPSSHFPLIQDQYLDEGVEWDCVEVDTNDMLVQKFEEVCHHLSGNVPNLKLGESFEESQGYSHY